MTSRKYSSRIGQWCKLKCKGTIFTARKRSLRRLCFHRSLSVHGGISAAPLHAGIYPQDRRRKPPPGAAPLWEQTSPKEQTPPPEQTLPPCAVHAGEIRAIRILLEAILVVTLSTSVHIYNAQIKGISHKHKSMVKPALKAKGCTSWSIHSVVSIQCAQRDTVRI